MPGEEDFGMAPVEALASGKPVVALGRGGALETVPPFGGILYSDPNEAGLQKAIERLEEFERSVRAPELRAWAERFSERNFMKGMARQLSMANAAPPGAPVALSEPEAPVEAPRAAINGSVQDKD
jgi:glycosyltransferase involved in cell wall biosynthesis